MSNNPPCKGCEKREIGCHGSCREYGEYKKEHREIKEKQLKEKMLYSLVEGRKINRRIGKGKGKHSK